MLESAELDPRVLFHNPEYQLLKFLKVARLSGNQRSENFGKLFIMDQAANNGLQKSDLESCFDGRDRKY